MADSVEELFGYNRGNFMFDQKLRQWREYQEQNMRVKQFMLYREDMRDLNELTISKMDSYLMIAVLELGCCLDLLVHGVLHLHEMSKDEQPTWNLWLYVISLAEAFVFLFLSAWLAIHASVSAHSFTVRLLTQFVRLPVPSTEQLNAASATGTDYENMGIEDILRIPVIRQQAERLNAEQNAGNEAEADPSGVAVSGLVMLQPGANQATAQKHVRVFRDLQNNWQAHDAYARACLALGTYKLIHALAYYTVGLLVLEDRAPWACLVCVMVLPALAWLLIRLDLYFSSTIRVIGAMVLMGGPVLALIAATLSSLDHPQEDAQFVLVAIIFAMHALLIVCVANVARAEHVTERGAALPTRFRNVLYLDVFGWLQSPDQARETGRTGRARNQNNGREMPAMLREALYKESCRLGRQLTREFSAWEIVDLDNLQTLLRQIRGLQREFTNICKDFSKMHEVNLSRGLVTDNEDVTWAQTAAESPVSSGVSEDSVQIWLRLECQSERITWFVQPVTNETRYEAPVATETEGKLFISDIVGVAGRLEMLRERVFVLQEDVQSGNHRSRFSRLAEVIVPSTGPRPGAGALAVPGASGTEDTGAASAAQETRFGGRESADLGGFIAPEATGQTFHPRRDRREESRQPPGQVPWYTFCGASTVLVTVWMVGIGWYVVNPLAMNSTRKKARMKVPLPPSLDMSLVSDLSDFWMRNSGHRHGSLGNLGEAHHRRVPLQAVGLACDDNHSSLVIAERFALHEVLIPSLGRTLEPSQSQNGLDRCLGEYPRFHADGLAGVRIKCTSPAGCHALILGAHGNQSLVCPLGASSLCQPTLLTSEMLGRARGCPVERSDLQGIPDMAFPNLIEASSHFLDRNKENDGSDGRDSRGLLGAKLVISLSDIPGHLGVSAANAWALGERERRYIGSWSFPATHRWTSLCHAQGKIFALGVPQAGESELWSFAMPEAIRTRIW